MTWISSYMKEKDIYKEHCMQKPIVVIVSSESSSPLPSLDGKFSSCHRLDSTLDFTRYPIVTHTTVLCWGSLNCMVNAQSHYSTISDNRCTNNQESDDSRHCSLLLLIVIFSYYNFTVNNSCEHKKYSEQYESARDKERDENGKWEMSWSMLRLNWWLWWWNRNDSHWINKLNTCQ